MENQNNSLDGNLQRQDQDLGIPQASLGPSTGSGFGHRRISPFGFDRLAFAITAVAVLVVLSISAVTYFLVNSSNKKVTDDTPKADKYSVSSVPAGTVKNGSQLQVSNIDRLAVNGQLQVSKTLVITPTNAPGTPTRGQIYYDKNTNTPYYYDGGQFVSLKSTSTSIQGITGAVNVGGGISLVNSTLVNSGVISIQGQTGAVNFASGSGIAINGSTITNTGVLGISGNPNQLAVSSGANGQIQLQIIGIQDGGVLIGTPGNGIDTVLPSSGGQCLISDISTQKPVFGSCTGQSTVTSVTVGANVLTAALTLQGAGGLNVTNSGQTITIDGSGIAPGGDVSFGATHTNGHITSLDNNGDLVSSALIDQTTGLQVQSGNYYVDLFNSGASTLTVQNTNGSNVANLTVTGVVQANGGIRDSNSNLYSFDTTPSGTSRELCYVDNASATNCPTGGNVSRNGTTNDNRIAKFDASGNIQNSALTETGTSLQVSGSAYSIDLQNAGSNSTLSILNSDGTRVANLSVEGSISTTTGFLQGTDLYTLPTNAGNGGVLCYVYSGSSNCPSGGDVSFGSATNGYVAYVDGSGNLSTTDLAFTPGQLQATAASYALDIKNNSVASTLNVVNSGTGGVANLAVSGSVTATGGLIAHTLTDNTSGGGGDLQITSTNNNIVFSINGGAATFTFPATGGTGQTICTSGVTCATGGGQAVILEPGTGSGTAQTSSANRPSIWINRTGGTGNIIQLQANGSDAFVIDSTGAANLPLASGLTLGTASSATGKLAFKASGNSNTVNLTVANNTGGYTLTLPTAAGSNGQCLTTTGSGVLTFANCLSGGGGNGVISIATPDTNVQSGAITLTSSNGSAIITGNGSSAIDITVSAGATGVNSVGAIDSQTKSANGAVISGSAIYLQTADGSAPGLVSTGTQTFAGAKTFSGNVTIQGSIGLTIGNGATQGKLGLVSAGSGATVTISSNNQAAARALTIPTISADDEICLKTIGNCASSGSNFIVNGTSQQTGANFNIQSVAGQVAAKIQGASGQDIIDFYASGNPTPVAKIDASGNLTAVGGTFTGALGGTSATFSGTLSAVGVNSGSGLIQGTGGLTVGGTTTLSSLGTGILHSSSLGVISSSAVQLGTDTSGSYVANLGALTGLSTTGNSGAGSTPTLSVLYGSTANTAVQGNTTLTCSSGTGNLTGGGNSITLGTGGTCNSLNLVASPTITGNMVVQGGTAALGVNGTATGQLQLGNATASSQFVTLQADSRSAAATITIPTGAQTSDEVCLRTLANCTGNGSGGSNFINNATSQQTGANFNIQSVSGQVAAKIQGASGQNIINFYGSASSVTPVATIDGSGNLSAVGGAFTGNFSQTGTGTFGTGTGTVSLNGNTTVTNGSLILGNGAGAGSLALVSASSGQNVTITAVNRANALALSIPGAAGSETTDTICLQTRANCAATGGNFIVNGTSQQTNANFNIQSVSGQVAAKIQGAASQDIIDFYGSASSSTVLAKIDSTGLLSANRGLTANGAAVSLNDSSNFNTSINGGSSTGTVSIGNTAAGNVTLQSGGDISINGAATTNISLGSSSQTGTITLGQSTASNTINIGNATIAAGNTGTINIGTSATSTGSTAVTIGSTNSTSSLSLQGGTGGINLGTSGVANTIQIGNTTGAVAQVINIGNNATASSSTTLTLGSTIGASPVTIQSGTSGVLVKGANSTAALQIQNASSVALLMADTTNMRVSVGNKGTATGQLYVSGDTPTGALGASNNSVAGAYGLAIQGRYAYVTPTNATGLLIYDISNPAASPLPLISSRSTASSANKKIKVQGRYAYIAGGGTFAIYDVSNPKSVPAAVGSVAYTSGTNTPALYVQGRYAYVGDSGTPTLYAFDISNPAAPVLAGSVAVASTSNGPSDIYVQGRYAYLVNGGTNRFQIVDVSNPVAPSLTGTITSTNITSTPTSVAVQGRYAYAGTNVGSIYVIDISDPALPVPASAIVTSVGLSGGSTHSLAVQGRYLYAGDATNGLIRTIDISIPASANLLSSTTPASAPLALVANGQYVYAANNTAGVILQSFNFGGAYTQQLEAGGIETDTLSIRGNGSFASDLNVQGSLSLGSGLQVAGNSSFSGGVSMISSQSTGTANVLNLNQQYAGVSGAVLNIQNSGTGADILLGSSTTGQIQTAGGTATNGISVQSGNATSGASGAMSLQSGIGTTGTGAITIKSGNASAGTAGGITIDVGTSSTGSGSIAIGNGAFAHNTTVGNITGTSTLTLQGGTGAGAIALETGSGASVRIASTGVAGSVQIGNTTGAVAQTIAIGNNATASSSTTLTLGSTIGTSPTVIQGGSSGIITKSTSTAGLRVQNASNSTVFNVDTSNSRVGIGTTGGSHSLDVSGSAQIYGGSNAAFLVCGAQFCNDSVGYSLAIDTTGAGSVYSNSAWSIQTLTNTATAFAIQNAAATNALIVSTSNVSITGQNGANATLKVAMDSGTGRSINAVGTINASNADYAEWIPWNGPKPEQGSIVDFHGSKMVVSSPTTAAFIGNDAIADQENAILVSFVGQVPVKVTGAVHAGDYLVPNPDGTAHGVAPSAASLSDYFAKVGTALVDGTDTKVLALISSPGANSQFNPQAISNFADINVTGNLTTQNLEVTGTAHFRGDIIVGGHIITSGDQLSSQVQTSAGIGATVSVDGNDTTGTITINTGSAPQVGDLAKLLFSKSYGKTPRIVISASNDEAAGLRYFKGATSLNDFMLKAKDAPASNTTYVFDYFIAE